jgi:DNA-binding transcriptional ArsR family regulator
LPIGEIQARLDMAASTLAHHLRSLANAGLIEQEKVGRSVINRACYERLQALAEFLFEECCADACVPSMGGCDAPGDDHRPRPANSGR